MSDYTQLRIWAATMILMPTSLLTAGVALSGAHPVLVAGVGTVVFMGLTFLAQLLKIVGLDKSDD